MIKVVYTYVIALEYKDELFNKFMLSGDKKFDTPVSNTGIKMYQRIDGDNLIVALDIYYNTLQDYHTRRDFELSNDEWVDIWFNTNNKHKELSVDIFECL